MSRDAAITLDWADGSYTFRLAWGELEMLQEATNVGPWVVWQRLHAQTCKIGDISHTIRLGLIGGGKTPAEALALTRQYVEARPPGENLDIAYLIISAGLHGAPDETVGEMEAASPAAESA